MGAELIITERCQGLYKKSGGTVGHCEHPISHSPPECGPDTIAKPYHPPVRTEQPEPVRTDKAPHALRVLEYINGRNSTRGAWLIHPTPAAALLAFAVLSDERDGGAVRDAEVSTRLGNAASTVRRHLKDHPTIARHIGRGWFAPVS